MDILKIQKYYGADENPIEKDEFSNKINKNKKPIIVGIVLLVLLLASLLIFFSGATIDPKFNLTFDGKPIGFSGTLSIDGAIVDSFSQEGDAPVVQSNGVDNINVQIGTGGIGANNVITLRGTNFSGGQISASRVNLPNGITLSPDVVFVDENGNININIDPTTDLLIDPSLIDYFSGDSFNFDIYLVLYDPETQEEYTFVIPVEIVFSEFLGTGCLQVSREYVTGPTKYGQMEIEVKLRITCDSEKDLTSFVEWKDGSKGSVEVHFANTYPTTLIGVPLEVKTSPVPGDYVAKIIYTPNSKEKGSVSDFKVHFNLENSESKITFSMINENLEQCVTVTTIDDTIKNQTDTASIEIDSSKCANPIEILICDNDIGCSGGVEGEILPSLSNFTLNKTSRVVTFSRGEISGVYGVSVHARVKGFSKAFIAEKEIFVLPTTENIFPEQFVVSLIGKGAKETVPIKNNQLTTDVKISSSICNLYESSFGVKAGGLPLFGSFSNEKEWLTYLQSNIDSYSGDGFYQTALIKSIEKISSARSTAYNISTEENAKIKQAYLAGQDFEDSATTMRELSDSALVEVTELDNELSNLNAASEANLASQLVSLVTSITSLYSDATTLSTNVSAAQTAVTTAQTSASTCEVAQAGLSTASSAMSSANSNSTLFHQEALQLLNTAKQLYSSYQQVEAMLEDSEEIDSADAVTNATTANEKLREIEERLPIVLGYLDEALGSAAINSFETASSDDEEAKYYLELALAEMQDIEQLKDEALAAQLAAKNNLTVLSDDSDQETELIIACIGLILDLISQTGLMQTKAESIRTSLNTAQTGLDTAEAAATAMIATCTACEAIVYPPGASQACKSGAGCNSINSSCSNTNQITLTNITSAITEVSTAQSKVNSTYASLMNNVATINSIYQYYQLYETLTSDYVDNLVSALEYFAEIIDDLYAFELVVVNTITDLEAAILAAGNLATLEKDLSDASTYLETLSLPSEFGEYNKERLVGLVATLVQSGFINGAYTGGVYTTRDTGPVIFSGENSSINKISFDAIKEDCDNKVGLTLPAYKTNLIKDVKNVEIEGKGVLSQWIFKNAKVNDVFESQIVDLLFFNDGLEKNSYATISIKFDEHNYAPEVLPTINFQPFNIPSSEVKEKEYKFHMKFNALERKGVTPNYNSICENSLMLGSTGSDALPNIILGWDWNNITQESTENKYLDATQFSILLSKKLSTINEFLKHNEAVCPTNPVSLILDDVVPASFNLSTYSENCFLPLSTKTYDNKPALYYYLINATSSMNDFEWGGIKNVNDLVEFLDFNITLMRDGFGLEFQNDFVEYYSKRILNANPAFVDSVDGMSRFFKNPEYLYFTSKEEDLLPKNDFFTTDSGLYNIKLLIDFTELPLLNLGKVSSRIKVVLDLIKPINDNFSPFYYTPFNGGVGLVLNNDRRFYGTSISDGSEFELIKNKNISLSTTQRDSLFKIDYTEQKDIFKLNSLKSNNSKLFVINFKNNKISVINSPTVATPLLFEVDGTSGDFPLLEYSLFSGDDKLKGKTHNLFLMNAVSGCKDFQGNNLSYINNTPDFLESSVYAIGFDQALTSGKVFVSTIAYSPQGTNFAISPLAGTDGKITSVNDVGLGLVQLNGIEGMPYNDNLGSSQIEDLTSLFNAVGSGEVCVSRLGEKEIYYWPEQLIYKTKSTSSKNTSLTEEINKSKLECIN